MDLSKEIVVATRLWGGEIKEKYVYPKFSDEEWEKVLKNQDWPDWEIPSEEIAHSFVYFKEGEEKLIRVSSEK